MVPLYRQPHFAFRFAECRIVARFHLDGVEAGVRVDVYRTDPATGARGSLMATGVSSVSGWVDLAEPVVVQAGDAFVAVPGQGLV